jgi:hypothetical protein
MNRLFVDGIGHRSVMFYCTASDVGELRASPIPV